MENRSLLSKAFAVGGVIFLLPSLITWVQWINVYDAHPAKTQEQKVAIYLNHFPDFLITDNAHQSVLNITFIAIVFSVIALVLSIISINIGRNFLGRVDKLIFKGLGIFTVIVGSFLILLNLFSLM